MQYGADRRNATYITTTGYRMKKALQLARNRVQDQENNPFIKWLADDAVSLDDKLSSWLPCCLMFAFGFKDLNNMVFRYEDDDAKHNPYCEVINNHTYEDENHWPWLLADLKTLGIDRDVRLSSLMKFLWSDHTRQQRWANYRMSQLALQAKDPLVRYCLIETIELFGHYLFGKLASISAAYERESGKRLVYLGKTHFEKEQGELANQADNTQEEMQLVEFDSATRELAMTIVEDVADLIEARWVEFYNFSQEFSDKDWCN